MLSTQIALQKARALSAALPGTSERPHFGEVMFYVGKQGFASCGEKDGSCRFVFELEPAHAERLLQTDPRFARYPFARQCLVLHAVEARSWAEVKELLLESYRIAAARGEAKPKSKAKPKPKRATPAKPKRPAARRPARRASG